MFDFSFDHSVTTKLIRVIYAGTVALISLIAVIMLLFAWSFSAWNGTLALITLLAAPVFWITWVVTARVFLEFIINQFKISEHLKVIRDRGDLR